MKMFKTLRNKLLIINTIAITLVLIIAFLSVFLITYGNIKKEVQIKLEREREEKKKSFLTKIISPFEEIEITSSENEKNAKQKLELTFSIDIYKNNKICCVLSQNYIKISDHVAEELIKKALSKNKKEHYFKYQNNYFAYKISNIKALPTVKSNSKNMIKERRVSFVDITKEASTLFSFIYTFIVVLFVFSIIIFFFSKFAADKSIEPIKESYYKQRRFISDASHELKTPLTVINTDIDLVLADKNDTVKNQEKWLNYIKKEGQEMSRLVNELLYLSKTEDPNYVSFPHSKFNLSETLQNSILALEAIIFEKELKLDYNITEDLFISGNKEQIKRVIIIILDNAIKYSYEKETINVNLERENKNIILTVSNIGEGISEEHLDKIFDRFYRVDESRNKTEGKSNSYGLGLSIAKNIVDSHKGKIKVTSINNKTTVKITL